MRGGVAATEAGNTYEQVVRVWRLAEFLVGNTLKPDPASWIMFQDTARKPWDDVVESHGPKEVHAWQVKNLARPLSPTTLTELLQSLAAQPDITRGMLGINHVRATPGVAGLDLQLVRGLSDASRLARGILGRFAVREQTEERCLSAVAGLVGLDLTRTFELLARLDVHQLGTIDDIRTRAAREVHQVFDSPGDVLRHLLEFVVGSPVGVRIHMDRLSEVLGPTLRRRTIPWAPPPPSTNPGDEALVWRVDERGVARTVWLSMSQPGIVAADMQGLLLGSLDNLRSWERPPIFVAILRDGIDPLLDDEFDHDNPPVRLETRLDAVLEDVAGITIPLGMLSGSGPGDWHMMVEQQITPLGSFDNILLILARVSEYAGGAHGGWSTRFTALDLTTGQPFDLWTEDDAKRYVASYGDTARRTLSRRLQGGWMSDEPIPEVTVASPRYSHAYQLRAELNFTFDVCHADADESWDEYSASVRLPVEPLPPALDHVARPPDIVCRYWDIYPWTPNWGWTRVPAMGTEARAALERRAQAG